MPKPSSQSPNRSSCAIVVPKVCVCCARRRRPQAAGTTPYHVLLAATGRNGQQRFWLVFVCFRLVGFATGCYRLRPRGSIKAPSFVVSLGYIARAPRRWHRCVLAGVGGS